MPFASQYLDGGNKVRLSDYFMRRLTRLEPPYVISMTAVLAALVVLHHDSFMSLLPNYLASLMYLHGWIFGAASKINIVAWSLEIEVQFYILAPLLSLMFFRGSKTRRRLTMVAVSLIAMLVQFCLGQEARFRFSVMNYLQYFLLGFILADIYISDWKRNPQKTLSWDWVGGLGLISLLAILSLPIELREPMLFGVIGLLYYSVFRGFLLSRIFSFPLISGIGGMCYSIYLLHGFVIIAALPITSKISVGFGFLANYALQAALTGVCVLIITAAYYLAIEKPCMQREWPQKLYNFFLVRVDRYAKLNRS